MPWNLKEKADRLLAQEEGAARKDWGGRVAFALVYPNTYAVGMSNLGFQTIYHHLNALPDVEIAALLGCRVPTVRTASHRGLAKLRQEVPR